MNESLTRVLVVKNFAKSLWTFPAGKVNKDEPEIDCAVREVKEETGFDGTHYVHQDDVLRYIQASEEKRDR